MHFVSPTVTGAKLAQLSPVSCNRDLSDGGEGGRGGEGDMALYKNASHVFLLPCGNVLPIWAVTVRPKKRTRESPKHSSITMEALKFKAWPF